MELCSSFRERIAPGGRRAIQLTSGNAFCYPLYYYIDTLTQDGRFLIHHRSEAGQLQLHRLDLHTGESLPLTHATCLDTRWNPWCVNNGTGVLDHRSTLNVVRNELYYWDGPACRSVHIETLADNLVFELDPGRIAIGQNCFTPDGRTFAYIDMDAESYAHYLNAKDGPHSSRHLACHARLRAFDVVSHQHRTLVAIHSPIHHVLPYGFDQLVFCHHANENAMLLTDLRGGWYTHLRTMDELGGTVCHYLATERGLMYEVLQRSDGSVLGGLYHPATHERREFELPRHFGYTHTGRDPYGRIWFYENCSPAPWLGEAIRHDMHVMRVVDASGKAHFEPIIGHWPTYGQGQKAHMHPQLVGGGSYILFTAGDPSTQTNHIFLLEAEGLHPPDGL